MLEAIVFMLSAMLLSTALRSALCSLSVVVLSVCSDTICCARGGGAEDATAERERASVAERTPADSRLIAEASWGVAVAYLAVRRELGGLKREDKASGAHAARRVKAGRRSTAAPACAPSRAFFAVCVVCVLWREGAAEGFGELEGGAAQGPHPYPRSHP